MAKKQNIRDKRNQTADARKSAFREKQLAVNEQKRQQEEQQKNEQKAKELALTLNPIRKRTLSAVNKSTAKAAGLKSTFVMAPNELLMTSFGKGNDAVIEKRVTDGRVETVNDKPNFTAIPDERNITFRIDGRVSNASADNPLHYSVDNAAQSSDDMIHARRALEKRYFGRNFEDNIHIQLIYNILDIEKILSIHVNNIVYVLNNFLRNEGQDLTDLVGYITLYSSYEKFMNPTNTSDKYLKDMFIKLCRQRQLGYYNIIVNKPNDGADTQNKRKPKRDPNAIYLEESEFFYALYALGNMRLMLAHGDPKKNIYTIGGFKNGKAEIDALLNRLYSKRIDELNAKFLTNSAKNLALLFKALNVNDIAGKTEIVRSYYDFTVRKQYKNMGFSIKLLREHMTADIPEAYVLRDMKYDTLRGKLYPFIDFVICRYYQQNPSEIEELVASLRASMNEVDKDKIYADEAKRVWPKLSQLILKHILPQMSGPAIKNAAADSDVSAEMLKDIKIDADATVFSKFIYLVTLFINGKEINDLLTTLIHKFESIAAFIDVLKQQRIPCEFTRDYPLFADSALVAIELRAINSFARMSKPSSNAKEVQYIEAFKVLGIHGDEEQLENEVKQMLDPSVSGKGSKKRGVRNFIANNVIESTRFKYLVCYGNVNKLKGIAENRSVVAFVLKDIPDDQIVRYYNSINGGNAGFRPDMRDVLTDRLTGFSFEDIADVTQNDRLATPEEQEYKRQKQALVRLYLTVIYLTLKNLVYINSRYFLAFHCVERDRLLLEPEKWSNRSKEADTNPEYALSAFAKDFIAEYPYKKRVGNYLAQNFANSDDWSVRTFRNKVEHLDAVRNADLYLKDLRTFNSWFELYHYVMQRRIMDQYTHDSTTKSKKTDGMIVSDAEVPKTLEYFALISRYRVYNKDFVKALCVPFAYNLPRYKNLCIDALFDKNNPPEDKAQTKSDAMASEGE